MTHRRRFVLLGLLLVAVVAGAVLWPRLGPAPRAAPAKDAAAIPVTAGAVVVKTLPVRLTAIGNVDPYTSVAVKARVDGEITEVGFHEGEKVHRDQLLFRIDPRPFQAALAQAQANLAKDQAQLDRARTQDARYKDLLAQNFISKDAYEQVRTNAVTAQAQVQADEAAVDNAKLQLAYCTIRSPIAGFAGRILVQQGNLVKANDANPLVTLNQIEPVYVTFSVPEHELGEIRAHQSAGDLVVQSSLPGGGQGTVQGRLSFVDNAADTSTGTIRLRATFANDNLALWPGQFVNVVLTLYQQRDALVAPSQAIQNGPNGQYVFVVRPDRTVELRNVKVARAVGDDTVIAEGLKPGETVVTTGQLRLAPGSRVTLDDQRKAG